MASIKFDKKFAHPRWRLIDGIGWFAHYSSIDDLFAIGDDRSLDVGHPYNSSKDGGTGWRGRCENWSEAVQRSRTGWADGVVQMREQAERARLLGASTLCGEFKNKARRVAGSRVDVGRFCSGDPRCMTRRRRAYGKSGRIVRLYADCDALSGVSGDKLALYGALLFAMVDKVQRHGVDVELNAIFCSCKHESRRKKDHKKYTVAVRVQRSGQKLSVERMAFALGDLPTMFRRGAFRAWEQNPSFRNLGSGYGKLPEPEFHDKVAKHMRIDNVLKGAHEVCCMSDEGMVQWAENTYREIVAGLSVKG